MQLHLEYLFLQFYLIVHNKINKTKIKIICSEHGVFEQRPNDHIYYGCLICGFKSRAISKTMTNESFIKKAKEKLRLENKQYKLWILY